MLNPFSYISDYFKSCSRYYRALTELSSLTDRELADIGLTRSDIHFVALRSANRRYFCDSTAF